MFFVKYLQTTLRSVFKLHNQPSKKVLLFDKICNLDSLVNNLVTVLSFMNNILLSSYLHVTPVNGQIDILICVALK